MSTARDLLLPGEGEEPLLEGHVQGADGPLLLPSPLKVVDRSPKEKKFRFRNFVKMLFVREAAKNLF